MDLFDSAIFDSEIFDTGAVVVSLHGGTKQRRGGRRDLDAIEQAREKERLAHLEAVRKFAAKKAAEQEPAKPVKRQTILSLHKAQSDAENEITQQAARLEAQETARVVAAQALADAIALRQQLDDEASAVFMAYLMAA